MPIIPFCNMCGLLLGLGRLWLHILLLGCMLTPLQVFANTPSLEVAKVVTGSVLLTPHLEVVRDAPLEWTLEQAKQADFVAASVIQGERLEANLHLGQSAQAQWLRLRLKNSAPQTRALMLEIAYPKLSDIRLQFDAGAAVGTVTMQAGSALPFSIRPYPHRNFVFPLQIAANTQQDLYLRVVSTGMLEIPATLWSPPAFYAYQRADYILHAMYFGMAMALSVFMFLLFLMLRNLSYLLYVILASGIALSIAALYGFAAEYLWGEYPIWNEAAAASCASFTVSMLILFMQRMLETAHEVPRLHRGLWGILLFHLVLALILPFAYRQLIHLALTSYVLSVLLILSVGLFCAMRGQHVARNFVAASLILAIASLASALHALGWLEHSLLATLGLPLGSAVLMLLLAFALLDRFNIIRQERSHAQATALEAHQKMVNVLLDSERVLEHRVQQRTQDLSQSNTALSLANTSLLEACQAAETSRQQALSDQQQASLALLNLRHAQAQLVQTEKMAALGQVVASVAHEINTPIGAVKSSSNTIASSLAKVIRDFVPLMQNLSVNLLDLLFELNACAHKKLRMYSTREERALVRSTTQALQVAGVANPARMAAELVQLQVNDKIEQFQPLLQHPQAEYILSSARQFAMILRSAENINAAMDRVIKIAFALSSYGQPEQPASLELLDLQAGLDAVLSLYLEPIGGNVELVRHYEAVPRIWCQADALQQVWSNLVHNALQAMHSKGRLEVGLALRGEEILVSITDTGSGIAPELHEKIFQAFFTTKTRGEGSGLGLDIVKKIVEQHAGRIWVESVPGQGACFYVSLPCRAGFAQEPQT